VVSSYFFKQILLKMRLCLLPYLHQQVTGIQIHRNCRMSLIYTVKRHRTHIYHELLSIQKFVVTVTLQSINQFINSRRTKSKMWFKTIT